MLLAFGEVQALSSVRFDGQSLVLSPRLYPGFSYLAVELGSDLCLYLCYSWDKLHNAAALWMENSLHGEPALTWMENNSERYYLVLSPFLLQTLRILFQGSCGEAELGTTDDGQRKPIVSHPSGDKA